MIVREKIFEKFEQETDPIKDMGIGFFKVHNFQNKNEISDFVANNLNNIFMIKKIPKAFIAVRKGWSGVIIKANNREYLDAYALKYIRLRGEKLIGKLTIDLFDLAKNLWDLKKGVIMVPSYDWKNKNHWLDDSIYQEIPKFLRDNVDEAFSEDSDPIKDMGIGNINVHKEFKTYKEGYRFVCKYVIPYIIGSDNIKNILNPVIDKKVVQVPIVPKIYTKIWEYVHKYLTVDGDPFDLGGEHLSLYIMHDKLRESFSEESDPIQDLGIGAEYDILLSDNFKPYLDKYHNKYNPYYNDPRKDHVNPTGMKKCFEKFKEDIEPLILNKFVEGRMWQVNRGWAGKKIKVLAIKGTGSKTMFHPQRNALSSFHVKASYFNKITGTNHIDNFALYLENKYHVTLK